MFPCPRALGSFWGSVPRQRSALLLGLTWKWWSSSQFFSYLIDHNLEFGSCWQGKSQCFGFVTSRWCWQYSAASWLSIWEGWRRRKKRVLLDSMWGFIGVWEGALDGNVPFFYGSPWRHRQQVLGSWMWPQVPANYTLRSFYYNQDEIPKRFISKCTPESLIYDPIQLKTVSSIKISVKWTDVKCQGISLKPRLYFFETWIHMYSVLFISRLLHDTFFEVMHSRCFNCLDVPKSFSIQDSSCYLKFK